MRKILGLLAALSLTTLTASDAFGQTPEQQQMWDAQHARAVAEEKMEQERIARERAARKTDPMAWVRSLDPMSGGGWEFRSVANDGSSATYITTHQLKRSGKTVTIWLRQEYAEPQIANNTRYLSIVEKAQYDCARQQERPMLVIYYSNNNIQGTEVTEEADPKTAAWNAIVPGTRAESNFQWACGSQRN